MFKLEMDGFDDLKRNLDQLAQRAQKLDGEHSVPMRELLTPAFLEGHTSGRFTSWEQWAGEAPFKIDSQEDFDRLPQEEWDAYVRSTTSFSDGKEMLKAAGVQYLQAKLFEC
jgi:hypothetical protein